MSKKKKDPFTEFDMELKLEGSEEFDKFDDFGNSDDDDDW